jgi:hypothetical protein
MSVESKTTMLNDDILPTFQDEEFEIVISADEEENAPNPNPVNQEQTPQEKSETEGVEDGEADAIATFNTLKAKGILDGEDVKTWEDLDQKLDELPNRIADELVNQIPEPGRKLLDFMISSQHRLDKDSLKEFVNTYLEDMDNSGANVDVSNNESAKDFLQGIYKQKGYKDSLIEVMVNALEDENDLIGEATRELNKIKAKAPKSDKLINDQKELSYQERRAKQDFVRAIDTELKDLGWSRNRINTIKGQLASGETNKILSAAGNSPKALVQLADLASYYDAAKGEFNFEAYIAQIASKDVKQIRDNVTKDNFGSIASKTKINDQRKGTGSLFDVLRPVTH